MNNSVAWILTGALALGYAHVTPANEMSGSTEKAVAALEQQWAQAQRTNNVEMEIPLLADKFAVTESDGTISERTKFIAAERATKYTRICR
jgi:hypothetical protein